jgi:hypothetical protein
VAKWGEALYSCAREKKSNLLSCPLCAEPNNISIEKIFWGLLFFLYLLCQFGISFYRQINNPFLPKVFEIVCFSIEKISMKRLANRPSELIVPYADKEKEFLKNATFVWRNHHSQSLPQRGRKSLAKKVIEVFFDARNDLIENIRKKQDRYHNGHAKNLAEPNDPLGPLIQPVWGCEKCQQKFPLKGSRYALRRKIIEKLKKQFCWTTEESEQKIRSIDRHIRAWLYILTHPEWLETGFPDKWKNRFGRDMIEAFEKERKIVGNHLPSLISAQFTAYELEQFFGKTTLPPSLPPSSHSK